MDYSIKTVLVFGVTGGQGAATAHYLLERGFSVRGFTRNSQSDSVKTIKAKNVDLIEWDNKDNEILNKAMEGIDGAFVAIPNIMHLEEEISYGKKIIDALHAHKVKYTVFSSMGMNEENKGVPHIDSKRELEKYIKELGLPTTYLWPVIFMEDTIEKRFFPPGFFGMMWRIVGSKKPVQWVAIDDIGFVAASLFSNPEKYMSKVIPVIGDKKSTEEVLDIFKSVTGKKPFKLLMPNWFFANFAPNGKELVTMFKAHHNTPFDWDSELVKEIHPEIMDVETWLRKKAKA